MQDEYKVEENFRLLQDCWDSDDWFVAKEHLATQPF
jgi:hypothetical protein